MEELGNSIPLSEGFVDAEGNSSREGLPGACLNCGAALTGKFCSSCGQKNIPRRQTLGELFENFISSFWSYEGKFFLTTKYLITRPGFLAVEYNKGRRESYYHPARMYVFISFIFFLLLFSLPDSDGSHEEVEMSDKELKELSEELKNAGLDSVAQDSLLKYIPTDALDSLGGKKRTKKNTGFSFSGSAYNSVSEYDSAQNALAVDKRDGWIARILNRRTSELNGRYKDKREEFGKDFQKAFMDNFSKVLFFLLPIFALLLKLFYVRRDFFYSEHLVFSIYYYNFFYMAASLQLFFNLIPFLDWVGTLIGFWIFFYLLVAMKRMYMQSWKKTILKFSLFSFVFMIFLGLGLTISALAVLLMI